MNIESNYNVTKRNIHEKLVFHTILNRNFIVFIVHHSSDVESASSSSHFLMF